MSGEVFNDIELEKKPSYREINGTTRVGDFLRKIGQSDFLENIVRVAKERGLPFLSIVEDFITENKEIKLAEKNYALKLLEYDLNEAKEISSRWSADMLSDSFLSKNIRPLVLIYCWLLITVMIFFKNEINAAYITLIEGLAITVNAAYFGSRAFEKIVNIKKK